ncbi:hypothetical protein Pyn_27956 [Prunus yedoensis var. nudiflora]|uniref:Uncharacterized protein n=1 Tax=Prunus yedoensis var. nudiflora TaxID=2094558 RepID=A0A314ZA82_PRUYE|nr:hypothetical protein Pyn_27956 [Prunus yedoensis var. nudiflora]
MPSPLDLLVRGLKVTLLRQRKWMVVVQWVDRILQIILGGRGSLVNSVQTLDFKKSNLTKNGLKTTQSLVSIGF